MDIKNFCNGNEFAAYRYLGAHLTDNGTVFRTYAPNASAVSVAGDFSGWEALPMKPVEDGGFYELIVPEAHAGMRYMFRISDGRGGFADHCDPYGFGMELRPDSCSVIRSISAYKFNDEKWLEKRTDCRDRAMNIYEVHLGSWKRHSDSNEWYSYSEIADELISYVCELGYNYIEFMPLSEHPCDESWGYQCTGFFAPTSRYGTPEMLMELVDRCHARDIGVIMDFVPVHFAVDSYALAQYDGTMLYEYPDDCRRFNEWGSLNFNHSEGAVRSFIQSAADYWLSVYHFDGLRMDAVRNMIYLNGDERLGENHAAIDFLKSMNSGLKSRHPSAVIFAEDSTAYPAVTAPVNAGGLGFDYKWDLGWMHDTLGYFQSAPMYRSRDYHKLTFSMLYFRNERFILPLSHDEVVHGKDSIAQKMNGGYEQKFPQARALYMYMIVHPGKKLSFMGNETALLNEWDEKQPLCREILKYPIHDSFREYIRKLNHIYLGNKALHYDYDPANFVWEDCSSVESCVYAIRRKAAEGDILAVFNFSDWYRPDYSLIIGEGYNVELLIDTDGMTDFTFADGRLVINLPPFSGRMFLLT